MNISEQFKSHASSITEGLAGNALPAMMLLPPQPNKELVMTYMVPIVHALPYVWAIGTGYYYGSRIGENIGCQYLLFKAERDGVQAKDAFRARWIQRFTTIVTIGITTGLMYEVVQLLDHMVKSTR